MKPLIMMAEAEAEMVYAAAFYEKQQKMLGRRFLAAVQDAFTRIRMNPGLYPLLDGDVRRCLLRVFPYGIVFKLSGGIVTVISVMHLHRDPERWKQR